METDDTKHLSTSQLKRLVLLEQLHNIQSKRIKGSYDIDTKETKYLSTSAIQRLVLLEQLHQIGFTETDRSHMETEETKHLRKSELQRLVLLEQFHFFRLQRKLEQV